MVVAIKNFIILLIISLIPSEWIRIPEEKGCIYVQKTVVRGDNCCFFVALSEIKCSLIAKGVSGKREILANYDENQSDSYQKNKHTPFDSYIEINVRAIDWVSHFKWNLKKLVANMSQKVFFEDEVLTYHIYSHDIFIPDLTYYVFTLGEITV